MNGTILTSYLGGKAYNDKLQPIVTATYERLSLYCAKEGRLRIWVICQAINEWLNAHDSEIKK
jgi:hypothetical protein